jgi:parvulin-like peptidyl-prolyl isomerase
MTWGDIKAAMRGVDRKEELAPFSVDSETERLARLQSLIDERILVNKGREAGLQNDPVFLRRTAEFRKTRLINLHRSKLIQDWQPTDEQLKAYFEEHRDSISIPEARKVQMVVVETREEAEAVKDRIDNGEITMYQAAQEYSIDPNAKRTLGDIGWVNRGSGFPELDELTFMLEPEEIGGPVQSPAGWHLVRVLDVRDAQLQLLSEPQTRKVTLRHYLKDKENAYVVALRLNNYNVVIDNENLQRLFQQEADWIAALSEKSKQEGSVTQERVKDMDEWIGK